MGGEAGVAIRKVTRKKAKRKLQEDDANWGVEGDAEEGSKGMKEAREGT